MIAPQPPLNYTRVLPLIAISLLIGLSSTLLADVKVDTLRIGTKDYKNAVVSLQGEDHVKIVHEAGIARVLASSLPLDIQNQLGWISAEKKATIAKEALENDYPIINIEIPNDEWSDNRLRDELNKTLDAKPNGKVIALNIVVTKNPNIQWHIKIIFDKVDGQLFHLERTVTAKGNMTRYALTKWKNLKRESLRQRIPWLDDAFNPLGKTELGDAPLNLQWECKERPEIAEWP
jgi:hypothetical protein